jgi:succinoglycan biosynthesis transport protein ExoP
MTLADYLNLLRSRIVLVLGIIAAATVVAFVLAYRQAPYYTATVKIRLLPAAPTSSTQQQVLATGGQAPDLGTEAELATSYPVARRVLASLHLAESPEQLLSQVQAVPLPGTAVLEITANGPTAAQAEAVANAFATDYLAVRRSEAKATLDEAATSVESELRATQARITRLNATVAATPPTSAAHAEAEQELSSALDRLVVDQAELTSLANQSAVDAGFGQVIQPAAEATLTHARDPAKTGLFGILVGVPLALAAVLLLDALGDPLRTEEEVQRLTGAEVLAAVPEDPDAGRLPRRLATDVDPYSPVAESYRQLAYNLSRVVEAAGARSILVTGPEAGGGKTTVSANLAATLAEIGRPCLLIEADLRRPSLAEFFAEPEAPGLTDLLEGRTNGSAVRQPRPELRFVSAGTPVTRPDLLLATADLDQAFTTLLAPAKTRTGTRPKAAAPRSRTTRASKAQGALAQVRGAARRDGRGPELVVVDSPPILLATEASVLAEGVDGVVLVLRVGLSRRKRAAQAAEQVRRAGGRLLGVVLTGVRPAADGGAYDVEEASLLRRLRDLAPVGRR